MLSPMELETLADAVASRVADRLANQRRLLSRQELAPIINVSLPKLDTMLRDGELPVIRVGRKVLFDPHAVIQHLSLGPQNTASESEANDV